MSLKLFTSILAALLVVAFVIPPAYKLKEPALMVVIVVGIVLMLIALYQSLHERD